MDVAGSVIGSDSGSETGFGLGGLPLFFGGNCMSVSWAFLFDAFALVAWACVSYVTGAWYSRAFLAFAGRPRGAFCSMHTALASYALVSG